jgi:hypothetical protein
MTTRRADERPNQRSIEAQMGEIRCPKCDSDEIGLDINGPENLCLACSHVWPLTGYKTVYTIGGSVSPKELTAFRMAPDIMDAMRALKDKEGIPIAAQVDRAVRAYLKLKGIALEADRKRARTRKRS